MGVPAKAVALAHADGASDEFSGVCLRPFAAWHRCRATLELLLDSFPMAMEHALAVGGSGDLHVDLRHDSAGGGKHSAGAGAAVVFRFAAASGSGEYRKETARVLPGDHCGCVPVAGDAPVVAGSFDAVGRGARPPAVADAVAAGALSGSGNVHVIWLRGRNHHAVLPGMETGHGYGSPRRSGADHVVADSWMDGTATGRHPVPWGAWNGVSPRPIRGGVLAGDDFDFSWSAVASPLCARTRTAADVSRLHPEFAGRNDLPLQPDYAGLPAQSASFVFPCHHRSTGLVGFHFFGHCGLSDRGETVC